MNKICLSIVVAVSLVGCASDKQQPGDTYRSAPGVTFKDNTGGGMGLPDGTRLKLLKMVPPQYPRYLRRENVVGRVIVRHLVQLDGTVTDASATDSPDKRLSEFAVAAVSKWRYEPYSSADGKPVWLMTSVDFSTP
jgi:TonB family protein